MESAARRIGLRVGFTALAIVGCAAIFAAYLRPDMLVAFGDIMAFCAALIR
jgi:hypothetical protein